MIVSDDDEDIEIIKRSLREKYGSITCKESQDFKDLGINIQITRRDQNPYARVHQRRH
jgi:hypothetical protein